MTLQQDLLNENILSLLGLESLPAEEKAAMLHKMLELLQKRVVLRVMDKLVPEDQKTLVEMGQNPAEVLKFLGEKVPELENIIREEALRLKVELLGAAK